MIIQMCRDAHQNKLEYSARRTHRWFYLKSWIGKISETGVYLLIVRKKWLNGGGRLVRYKKVIKIGLNSVFVVSQLLYFRCMRKLISGWTFYDRLFKRHNGVFKRDLYAQNVIFSFNHSAVQSSSYNKLFPYFVLKRATIEQYAFKSSSTDAKKGSPTACIDWNCLLLLYRARYSVDRLL